MGILSYRVSRQTLLPLHHGEVNSVIEGVNQIKEHFCQVVLRPERLIQRTVLSIWCSQATMFFNQSIWLEQFLWSGTQGIIQLIYLEIGPAVSEEKKLNVCLLNPFLCCIPVMIGLNWPIGMQGFFRQRNNWPAHDEHSVITIADLDQGELKVTKDKVWY